MKVLHLPTSVGGNAFGLSRGERKIGINSDVLIAEQNYLEYDYDILAYKGSSSLIAPIKKALAWYKIFLDIRNKYDVYHFNFGSTMLPFGDRIGLARFLDLKFYKKGAKIVVTYNGCDARQKYPTMQRVQIAACHNPNCYNGMCNGGALDLRRRKSIEEFKQYAQHFFSMNPDLFYFLPDGTSFLPYTIASWDDLHAETVGKNKNTLTIVHAPSNRVVKGSQIILDTLDRLQNKYKNLNVILVENKSYAEAIKLYQQADLVIDQILVGWYGAFAVEVMKLGKPVAVFIREEDLKFVPVEMAKDCSETFINVNPMTLFDKLSEILENPILLSEYAQKSIEYVNRWHNPIEVAKQTKMIYESI